MTLSVIIACLSIIVIGLGYCMARIADKPAPLPERKETTCARKLQHQRSANAAPARITDLNAGIVLRAIHRAAGDGPAAPKRNSGFRTMSRNQANGKDVKNGSETR